MSIALIIGFIGKNWKLFAAAAVLLFVLGSVTVTRMRITHLKGEVATYKTANAISHAANQSEHATVLKVLGLNAANQKVCTAAESAARANLVIAKKEAKATQARAADYGSITHAIQAAPADSSPVSPVVRGAVDGVWQQP